MTANLLRQVFILTGIKNSSNNERSVLGFHFQLTVFRDSDRFRQQLGFLSRQEFLLKKAEYKQESPPVSVYLTKGYLTERAAIDLGLARRCIIRFRAVGQVHPVDGMEFTQSFPYNNEKSFDEVKKGLLEMIVPNHFDEKGNLQSFQYEIVKVKKGQENTKSSIF